MARDIAELARYANQEIARSIGVPLEVLTRVKAVYVGVNGEAVKVWERDQQTQKEEGGSNE